jgi:hypothetical protein
LRLTPTYQQSKRASKNVKGSRGSDLQSNHARMKFNHIVLLAEAAH